MTLGEEDELVESSVLCKESLFVATGLKLSLDIKSADREELGFEFDFSFKGFASGSERYVSIMRLATSLRFLAFASLLTEVATVPVDPESALFFSSIYKF